MRVEFCELSNELGLTLFTAFLEQEGSVALRVPEVSEGVDGPIDVVGLLGVILGVVAVFAA